MIVAVDKHNYMLRKNDDNEYVYVFDKENLQELLDKKMRCIYVDNVKYVDINTTKYNINCKRKAKITDNFEIKKRDYKIGIIIPNRNYAEFLPKCFESILNQTYKNYEVIFIDDMSADNSIEVAKLYKVKFDKVCQGMKIIELKQRRYNGGARNTGYLHLSEDTDYVYHFDADDWFYDKYALQKINNALQYDEPDVLFTGIAKCKNGIITKEHIPRYKDRYEAFEGWSGIGKAIKKDLVTRQECLAKEGTLQEDRNQHRRICIYMNDFKCLEDLIYVWNQDNYKSVTHIRDKIEWKTSTIRHYADIIELALSVKGKDYKIDKLLEECINKCREEIRNNGDRQH